MPLQNSDIVKGSVLQVKIGTKILGFATSHSLSITTNTTEVSTKDHGDYPAIIAQNLTWEVQCENLYTDENGAELLAIQTGKTLVDLVFAPVSNYNSQGIVGTADTSSYQLGDAILSGKAYLTSFSLNAPAGDNATVSCTFTGCGAFTTEITN